jgi:hypothetical protein
VARDEQIARAGRIAGRFVGKYMPKAKAAGNVAARQFGPSAKHSRAFVKHVVPATVKPIHSLWHQIIAFLFLSLAGMAAVKTWRQMDTLSPVYVFIAIIFVLVTGGYGLSSVRKARQISKS